MNFLSMDYFAMVAHERSFTRAAEQLHITQQTLSAHIAALEKELGSQLLLRRTPLELTYPGQVFLEYALDFQRKYRQLLEDLYGPERQRVTEEVRSRQSLDPLKDCPFVVNSEEDVVGSLRQALFAQLDVEPSVRVMSKNLGMLLDLCLRGVGACFCPENMALATLTQEQLDSVERFRFSHGARFPIRIGCRRQARRWSLLSDFVDLTQQMLGEEEYQP